MTGGKLSNDHWVSRGYQRNFSSDEHRVAVLDAGSGTIVDPARPIKSNFCEEGFTTFLSDAGVPEDLLERAFASVERSVLNQIREIDSQRSGSVEKAAAANLSAIHLVRSPSYKRFRRQVAEGSQAKIVGDILQNPTLASRFEAQFGHAPTADQLRELADMAYGELMDAPMDLVRSMLRQHDTAAGMLNGFHMQVVEVAPELPGLIIGDTPIVHARPADGRYGFRDRLALGDATLIVAPLARRVAVCFSATELPHETVTTRKALDTLNGLFIRAAVSEFACHPEDAKAARQTHDRLDRHPPGALFG
jgi:hypothetical protein